MLDLSHNMDVTYVGNSAGNLSYRADNLLRGGS